MAGMREAAKNEKWSIQVCKSLLRDLGDLLNKVFLRSEGYKGLLKNKLIIISYLIF